MTTLAPGAAPVAYRRPPRTLLTHAAELRRLAERMLALAIQRDIPGQEADREAARRLRDIAARMAMAADRFEALERDRLRSNRPEP
ncbi:hypothetical protein [Siccirubricoccus phaeus]|uniref:hypothetical protein n=1 Tax=Siccirubricoccus phaeus TaxID=2595053 RepID=UPI0011F39E92|nr:hypothetical protein [Siccirubricoccus phaeus]